MRARNVVWAALLGAAIALPALAQGPGPGGGPGRGAGFRYNQDNTPGWGLMSREERTAYRDKMRAAKTYEECKAIYDEHRRQIEARAKEQGKTLRQPRYNACERMKARGYFK
jgi:hypothetical protein